jgi:DNA-binding PadR family transcriptional regulator
LLVKVFLDKPWAIGPERLCSSQYLLEIYLENIYNRAEPFNNRAKMTSKTKNGNIDELISDFSRFYILTILYEGPAHGYQIINRFKKRVKKDVSPSLVYPFLKQLEKKGLVKHTVKPVGEKERKVFELTQKGRELCTGLFKRFAQLVSIAIEPSLYVCAHCGCKVYEGGYREVIEGKETTFCCMHCARSYKETQKLAKKAIK